MLKWFGRILLGLLGLCVAMLVVGVIWQKVAEARDLQRYPPPGQMIDVGGRRLHIRCEGSGRGPTVVMVAGGGTPSVVSYGLQDQIAAFARVCSYDRPGLGWSDPATKPMSLDDHVADLDRLLAGSGIKDQVVLAPESFGAIISIAYAERHPGRVAGIIFVDGAEPKIWNSAMRQVNKTQGSLQEGLMRAAWLSGAARLALPSMLPPFVATLPSQTQGEIRAIYSRPSPGFSEAMTVFETTPAAAWPSSEPGALGSMPLAVISHGKASSMVSATFEKVWPEGQARLAALSTAPARRLMVSQAGHAIAQEEPRLVANVVRAVVESSARAQADPQGADK